jgi:hypothetical protein
MLVVSAKNGSERNKLTVFDHVRVRPHRRLPGLIVSTAAEGRHPLSRLAALLW